MDQEASTEVMVAGVGCGRKKKRLQRREKGWKEKRERAAMAAWWSVGRCVGFMWCSWWRPWSVAGTAERERTNCRNQGWRGWFLADFRLDFLLPQTLTSTSIYKRGKRAILSTLRKNSSP
jgi:hypothetical protein